MNKRLVLLNPKFVNQKRIGTAPAMDGRQIDEGGLGATEADMEGVQEMGEDQNAPAVENVDESGQMQEGGQNENVPPEGEAE